MKFLEAVAVIRDPDPVEDLDNIPSTMQVLHGLPEVLIPNDSGVFIRKQYDVAHDALKSSCTTHSAVIITGHPGIGVTNFLSAVGMICTHIRLGKTMLLYYVLAHRLLNKQPTFFQFRKDFVILFGDSGVGLLSPVFSVPKAPADSWVLIDSNTSVESVPQIFIDSAYFVVMAAPPHPRRWKSLQRYRPDINMWFMEPFTLEELIQALVFF